MTTRELLASKDINRDVDDLFNRVFSEGLNEVNRKVWNESEAQAQAYAYVAGWFKAQLRCVIKEYQELRPVVETKAV